MSVNISNTTPAAPAGNQLITFQTDGSGNVTGYVPQAATLVTASSVDLTGQGANISATNLVASPSTGMYKVTAYIIVTTVDAVSSTLPSVVITWTDPDNSTSQSLTLTATSTGNTLTTYKNASAPINVFSGAAIQYSTTGYLSNTASQMKYALHIRVEAM
jgi:hypothetical protein